LEDRDIEPEKPLKIVGIRPASVFVVTHIVEHGVLEIGWPARIAWIDDGTEPDAGQQQVDGHVFTAAMLSAGRRTARSCPSPERWSESWKSSNASRSSVQKEVVFALWFTCVNQASRAAAP